MKNSRTHFADLLRGVAAIGVMCTHLGLMYYTGGASSAFPYMLPPVQESTIVSQISTFLSSCHFSLGPFSVALFFLVSGFVINFSLRRNESFGRYFIRRLLRIWPLYVVGFSFTFVCIWLYIAYFRNMAVPFPYAFEDWLIQACLVQDIFWRPSIDGIIWTLQIEMHFYLVAYLLHRLSVLRSAKRLMIGGGGLCLLSWLGNRLLYTPGISIGQYAILYIISQNAVFFLLMFIGNCVYQAYMGTWRFQTAIAEICGLFALFCVAANLSVMASQASYQIVSCLLAVLLFVLFWRIEDKLPTWRGIQFISRNSYPLYIIHGVNGYLLMNILDHAGVSPALNILIAMSVALSLAVIFHNFVEIPLQKFAGKIMQPRKAQKSMRA